MTKPKIIASPNYTRTRGSGLWTWLIGLLAVVLIGAGLYAFAATQGWVPFMTPSDAKPLSRFH